MSRRNQTVVNIPDEAFVDDDHKTPLPVKPVLNTQASELHVIPPSTLHNHNLKKIKSFRKLRQCKKVDNQQSIFINDMKSMLDHMKVEDNDLNRELLVEVCNIANEFFIYGDKETRESSKIDSIQQLLLPYFRNDTEILNSIIDSMKHKIIKSNFVKRAFKRIKNFFF